VSDITQGKQRRFAVARMAEFFLADVQNSLGPFLAPISLRSGWNPGRCGLCPDFWTVWSSRDADSRGTVIDAVHRKRGCLR